MRRLRQTDDGASGEDRQEREVQEEGGRPIARRRSRTRSSTRPRAFTNYHACDFLSNKEYTALVDSLLDEEDDVEAEFSMYKCQMIKDGTYYSKAAED